MLTDGNNNEANAFWYPEELTIPSSGRVEVNFTYTASGNRLADGVTFAFQTSGTNAIGGAGGLLGYTGISGPTAAYQINIYNGHVIGSNFVTDNSNSNYLTTAPVNLNSGNPIDVVLIFDTDSNTVTETLTETVNSTTVNTFTRTYSDVDLRSVLGAKAYVGFTGGDGGANSIQTITNFSLATSPIYGATLAFQSQGTGVVGVFSRSKTHPSSWWRTNSFIPPASLTIGQSPTEQASISARHKPSLRDGITNRSIACIALTANFSSPVMMMRLRIGLFAIWLEILWSTMAPMMINRQGRDAGSFSAARINKSVPFTCRMVPTVPSRTS